MENLILKVAKEMSLNVYEIETLTHDINNLRGNEWLEDIKKCCSKETYEEFNKILKA